MPQSRAAMIRRLVLTGSTLSLTSVGTPMDALAGPLHLIALVLVVSGMQKLLDPAPAAAAMRAVGLRVHGAVLGMGEVALGLAALAWPHPVTAGLLALAYAALAAFVVVLRRRDAGVACGCFGSSSTPPSTTHVVLNLASAALATTAAATGPADLVAILTDSATTAVPYAMLVLTGASLVLLAPALLAGVRVDAHRARSFRSTR